jgi:RNA polymerase sigma-70 factor (ECF subfamily)
VIAAAGGARASGERQGYASVDPERDEENARWTAALTEDGPARERAADALYIYLLRAARSEISRRSDSSRLSGAERDDLAHQAAADALVSIIRRVPDFRGDSMFTTWARSFVTFEVRVKIRQHNRRSLAHGLTAEEWDRLPSSRGSTPEAEAEAVALKQAVMTAMDASLTERQRHVFLGVVVHGATIEQLATQLGSNRNAIYQLMFHARRNLRRHLVERGFVHGLSSP